MDFPHHSETFVFEHTWLKSVWALGGLYNCASPRPWWRPLPTWWCMSSRRRRNKNSFSAAFGIHGLLRAKTVRCLRIVSKCEEAITPSPKNRNLLISRSLLPNLDIVLKNAHGGQLHLVSNTGSRAIGNISAFLQQTENFSSTALPCFEPPLVLNVSKLHFAPNSNWTIVIGLFSSWKTFISIYVHKY